MLYFDRIYVSKGTDYNKTSTSKVCDICHYWYFLKKGLKFQSSCCNWCHDLLMISMNLSNFAVWNIKIAVLFVELGKMMP